MNLATMIVIFVLLLVLIRLLDNHYERKKSAIVNDLLPDAHRDMEKVINDVLVLGQNLEFIKSFDGKMNNPFIGTISTLLKSKNKFYKGFYDFNLTNMSLIIIDLQLMSDLDAKITLQNDIQLYTKYISEPVISD